jgi:hypothetical protein
MIVEWSFPMHLDEMIAVTNHRWARASSSEINGSTLPP